MDVRSTKANLPTTESTILIQQCDQRLEKCKNFILKWRKQITVRLQWYNMSSVSLV